LSKYFASEHLLKCEKLELSGPRKEYMWVFLPLI
jgi:hypothetical protein